MGRHAITFVHWLYVIQLRSFWLQFVLWGFVMSIIGNFLASGFFDVRVNFFALILNFIIGGLVNTFAYSFGEYEVNRTIGREFGTERWINLMDVIHTQPIDYEKIEKSDIRLISALIDRYDVVHFICPIILGAVGLISIAISILSSDLSWRVIGVIDIIFAIFLYLDLATSLRRLNAIESRFEPDEVKSSDYMDGMIQ